VLTGRGSMVVCGTATPPPPKNKMGMFVLVKVCVTRMPAHSSMCDSHDDMRIMATAVTLWIHSHCTRNTPPCLGLGCRHHNSRHCQITVMYCSSGPSWCSHCTNRP
jgi:hypothetical protein